MGTFSSFILLMIVSGLTRGYALSKLWAWFVEPTFHAPHLRIPVALGIACIISFLTVNPHAKTEKEPFFRNGCQGLGVCVSLAGTCAVVRLDLLAVRLSFPGDGA